jgi:diacylglycerol kinase family enzyme
VKNEKKIDTLMVNNNISLNMTGVGFDAEVAHRFEKHKSRGFLNYVYSALRTFFNYKPVKLILRLDDEMITVNVFSISFANSRQFGNNSYIAPNALLDDGLMDIAIINPFPVIHVPILVFQLFTKSLSRSKYYRCIKTKKSKSWSLNR